MGTLPLGSHISISLQHLTTTLGALCRPGLAVWYTSVSLCGSVRLVSYAVSNSGVVCAPTQQSQRGRHCLRWYSRHFDRLVLAGNDIVDFQWGKKDEWLSWEAVLYALVWMRMVLIEHELVFEEALYKKPFPYVDAKGESDKLECVVQLMRNPLDIRPTWSTELRKIIPAFPPNTKLHFSARALADYLRRVSRKNTRGQGWGKYSITGNPRILASRDKWWPLVANPNSRSYLVDKLKTYMAVEEGDQRHKTQHEAARQDKKPRGRPPKQQPVPTDNIAGFDLHQQIEHLQRDKEGLTKDLAQTVSRHDITTFTKVLNTKLTQAAKEMDLHS